MDSGGSSHVSFLSALVSQIRCLIVGNKLDQELVALMQHALVLLPRAELGYQIGATVGTDDKQNAEGVGQSLLDTRGVLSR